MSEIYQTELALIHIQELSPAERLAIHQFDLANLFGCSKVTVHGVLYKEGLILAHSLDLLPQFGRIRGIFIFQNTVYFSLNCMTTGFMEHIRMFSIVPNGKVVVLAIEKLIDFYPLVDYSYCGESVIPLKHSITQ